MTADPKVRSVYDLSYAANAVLTRVSGPTSSCLKQHQTPILVGSDALQYAPYAYMHQLLIQLGTIYNWCQATSAILNREQPTETVLHHIPDV